MIRKDKIIRILFGLYFLWAVSCTSDKGIKTDVPVVRLAPKEAETLKISDFFESYRLYEFKGILFTDIDDFMELGDKWVANLSYASGRSVLPGKLAIFDSLGNFLYQIGKNGRGPGEYVGLRSSIQIKKDTSFDIIDLNGAKYLNYSPDNRVNREQPLSVRVEGYPEVWLNDTLLLMSYIKNEASLKSLQYYIYLTQPDKKIIYKKYLPADPSKKEYSIKVGTPYEINDTICIYSEEQACIYNIFADTLTPRYYFDKGRYAGFAKTQDLIEGKVEKNIILNLRSFENKKYLFGQYYYDDQIYYFIYDKKKRVTSNYKNVNEDLVFMNEGKWGVWPSKVILWNMKSLRIDDDYLYLPFIPSKFRGLVEEVKNSLTPEAWEHYRRTHADIIEAYDHYDEETCNPVIIGFKYK